MHNEAQVFKTSIIKLLALSPWLRSVGRRTARLRRMRSHICVLKWSDICAVRPDHSVKLIQMKRKTIRNVSNYFRGKAPHIHACSIWRRNAGFAFFLASITVMRLINFVRSELNARRRLKSLGNVHLMKIARPKKSPEINSMKNTN